MDHLDATLTAAAPLLTRVDEVLNATGAPAGHAVWSQLRRVRLLPGDAVEAVAALDPVPFYAAVPTIRASAQTCAAVAADLPPPDTWTGEAADAYDDRRARTAAHLSGGDDSVTERLEATADLAQAVADWMTQTRAAVAAALAEAMTSSAAAALTPSARSSPAAQAAAAADVAAHVLNAIAESYTDAEDLLRASSDLTTAIPI
nr:hypothetical protein [uncultured Actinoplanes sp.]